MPSKAKAVVQSASSRSVGSAASALGAPMARRVLFMLSALAAACSAQSPVVPLAQRTWMDTTDPPSTRAAKILLAMNFTKKTMLLSARDSEDDKMGFYIGMVETSHRLGMPWLRLNDGPQGYNDYQKHPGTTTNWPSGLTVASTFDRRMARAVGCGER